ncbi:MAG: FlgO family outer membrane protein [Nitrospinota bacterium]|jgi:TolB-like protein|nr:FlgO family outer membrane protein [Nitrospinota bacterium]
MATPQSRTVLYISLLAMLVVLAGCELKFDPAHTWDKWFKPETDTEYYQDKSDDLVATITRDVEEYEINKVVVLDLVDDKDKVPILGQYMSNRVVESLTRNRTFRVAQRGEVVETLNQLDLKHSFKYTSDEIQRLGKAMNAQALVMGKLLDIGANIDVHVALVDIASGEVIASASEQLIRTRSAVELLRHY